MIDPEPPCNRADRETEQEPMIAPAYRSKFHAWLDQTLGRLLDRFWNRSMEDRLAD